jgi:glycosyltransferase 2 family protein
MAPGQGFHITLALVKALFIYACFLLRHTRFRYNRSMRKFLIAVAMLLGVVFLLTRFAELEKILSVLQRGNILYLGLALLLLFAWVYNLGALYQAIYRVLGMEENRLYLVKLAMSANFLTIIAPSAGLSGMAIFISDARRKNRPTGKVTVAGVLYVWFEYLGTLAVAVIGLGELAHRNTLHWAEITASLILLAGALLIGILLFLGIESPRMLAKTLNFLARAVNRLLRPLIHRSYLTEERAFTFTRDVSEGIGALREHPHWAGWPIFYALLNKLLLMAILLMCFLAFKVPAEIGTIVAGLSIAQLFLIVSPTPSGIGIVEGVLAVALRSLGVPLESATVITLAYRSFAFWIPLLIGMVTLRMLDRQHPLADKSGLSEIS